MVRWKKSAWSKIHKQAEATDRFIRTDCGLWIAGPFKQVQGRLFEGRGLDLMLFNVCGSCRWMSP